MFHMNGNRNERNIRNMADYSNLQLYEELHTRFNYLIKVNNQFKDVYIPYIEDKTNKKNCDNLLKFLGSNERRNNIKSIILDTEPILEELISRFYKLTVDIEQKLNPESSIFNYRKINEKNGQFEDKVTYIGYIKSSKLFNNLDALLDLKPRFDYITDAKEDHINSKFKDRYYVEIFRFDRNNFAHSSNVKGKQLHDFILAYFSTNTFSAPNSILNSNFYILDDYFKYKFNQSSKQKQDKIRSNPYEYNKFITICTNSFKKWYLQRYEMLDVMFKSFLQLTDIMIMTINYKNRHLLNEYMTYGDFNKYERFVYNTIIRHSDKELLYNVSKGMKKRELSEIITDKLPSF